MHTVQDQTVSYKRQATLPDTVIIFGLFDYPNKKQTFGRTSLFQPTLFIYDYLFLSVLFGLWSVATIKRQT